MNVKQPVAIFVDGHVSSTHDSVGDRILLGGAGFMLQLLVRVEHALDFFFHLRKHD